MEQFPFPQTYVAESLSSARLVFPTCLVHTNLSMNRPAGQTIYGFLDSVKWWIHTVDIGFNIDL